MNEPRGRAGTRRTLGALAALTAVAFALRVLGARSSIAYSFDADVVREALDLGDRLVSGDLDVRGASAQYPLTLAYVLVGVYGLLCSAAWAIGALPGVEAIREFAFTHRELVYLVAVYAFALIGAALVPLVHRASRALDERHTGWLAAALAATNVLLVHFGHQPRPHVALATFALLSLMLLVGVAEGAPRPWTTGATVASALTFGVHQIGIAIAPTFALAWLCRIVRRRSTPRAALGEAIGHAFAFGLLCLVVYPGFVSDVAGVARSFFAGETEFRFGAGDHRFRSEEVSLSNLGRLAVTVYWYQPALAVAAPLTLAALAWKLRRRAGALVVGAGFVLSVVLSLGSYSWTFPRMAAILVPILVLATASLGEDLALALARLTSWRRGVALALVSIVLVGPPLVTACRLVFVTARADTRTLAREWMQDHAAPGETVLANFQMHEVLPSAESLRRQAREARESVGSVRRWLLGRRSDERPPEPAFQLIDYNGLWPADPAKQEALARERGIRWAIFQVHFWRSVNESDAISEFLGTHGNLVGTICPGRGLTTIQWPERYLRGADGAYLPEDVEADVWRYVWSVERPGPIVLLFEVSSTATRAEASLPGADSICR